MKRLPRLLLIFALGAVSSSLLLLSCRVVYLPFGYTLNFAPRAGEAMSEAALSTRIRAPRGFSIHTFARNLPNARWMAMIDTGDIVLSRPRAGEVVLVQRDADGDGVSDGSRVLLTDLDRPHGLALHAGHLYVAETGGVFRVPFDAPQGVVSGEREVIIDDLPPGGNHWTRSINFGPDGKLYVSVGSTCNVCIEDDPKRAAMLRYNADGSGYEVYATGLRNSVGFAWQPGTDRLFATDNGRDLLGDDFPPCELNQVVEGGFYGWPFANGAKIPDPDFGGNIERVEASIAPVYGFAAHNAPLGITFYDGDTFPKRYHGAAFVALHGSWNRSTKDGYKVVAVWVDERQARAEDFIVGFEEDEDVVGRPVDLKVGPDGALYLSDDFAGVIYRITHGDPPANRVAARARQSATREVDPLAGISRETVAKAEDVGRQLWAKHACASCHEGQGPDVVVRPLANLGARYDVATLDAYLRTPQPPMPAFPITGEERRLLAIDLLRRFP